MQDKIFRIAQNYKENGSKYDEFISRMNSLVERVNRLPVEHREPFGQLKGKPKETRLENHLHCFSSSRRIQKREYRGILHPLKMIHYKHIRLFCISVAKNMGMVEIEIREKYLEKVRKDGKLTPEEEGHGKHKKRRKHGSIFHEVYHYDIDKLTEGLALNILDWLAFRTNIDQLPVVSEGKVRQKKEKGS